MAYRATVNRGNSASGKGKLYDWGDGHGRVHSRPKRAFGAGVNSLPGVGGGATAQASGGGYGSGANGLPGVHGVQPNGAGPTAPSATPMDPRITAYTNNQTAELGHERDETLAYTNVDADRAASDYGFNITKDASGNPTFNSGDLTVNPQDPFSKMALLQKSYEGQQRGTTNSYASSGQLYSGALLNKRAADTSQNDQDKDALAKAFRDTIEGLRRQRAGAVDTYTSGVNAAGGQALQLALGG